MFHVIPALSVLAVLAGARGAEAPRIEEERAEVRARAEIDGEGVSWWSSREHGRLGVTISDVDSESVKDLKLPEERGTRITRVEDGSPAEAAGLSENDVIWEFRGEPVWSVSQLRRLVEETPVGREVSLRYYRDGALKSAELRPRSGSGAGARVVGPNFSFDFDGDLPGLRGLDGLARLDILRRPRLGLTVNPLSEQLADFFGSPQGGVLVTSVDPDSPAQKAGVRAGDVIQKIDGRLIESALDLREALSDAGEVTLEIVRDKKPLTLKANLERKATRGGGRRM